MLELLFFTAAVLFFTRQLAAIRPRERAGGVAAKKVSPKVKQQADYANRLFDEKKFLSAEKAYMEILKHDHRNVQAYNRLGLIAAALKRRDDAIESFRMVTQLAPSAQSHHNLGLAYYENKNYIKAIAAFEKALIFEPTAARYIALAKAYQRILNKGKMLGALEKAYELEPSQQNLLVLADAYAYHRESAKAKRAYEQVLQNDPKNQKAQIALAAL